jgi:hypothetical protein
MANAKIIELVGLVLTPTGVRASVSEENKNALAAPDGTGSHPIRPSGKDDLRSKSHIETYVTSIIVQNSHKDAFVSAGSEYCYPSARRHGPKSENCCRYCGNLMTSNPELSRKPLSNKQLDFPKSGP